MEKLLDRYCRLLDALMVAAMAGMVLLVFGNVVLRYLFNSGISASEELARWLFVWLTFVGAVVALKEHGHLGTDALVSRLPPAGKKACLIVGQILMLYATWILLAGSWEQALINLDVHAPVTGIPIAVVYASGIFFGVSAIALLLRDLWRAASGQLRDDELVMVRESEELEQVEELHLGDARLDGTVRA